MTSTKKWGMRFLLALICGGVIVFLLLHTTSSKQPTATGLWALLEEKVPNSHLLDWQQDILRWQKVHQISSSTVDFTARPAALFSTYSSTDHLLSGKIHQTSDGIYDISQQIGTISGKTLLSLAGIKDEQATLLPSVVNDEFTLPENERTSFQHFEVEATRQVNIYPDEFYFYLADISFTADEQARLPTLRQRYFLLNQYTQRRIRFSRQDLPWITVLLPNFPLDLIESNNQKSRIIPDNSDGWIYLLSGDSLIISGHTLPDGKDTIYIHFPQPQLSIQFTETPTPQLLDMHIQQTNRYQATGTGSIAMKHTRTRHLFEIESSFQGPSSIAGTFVHSVEQKKGKVIPITSSPPAQFLGRSTIRDNRSQLLEKE